MKKLPSNLFTSLLIAFSALCILGCTKGGRKFERIWHPIEDQQLGFSALFPRPFIDDEIRSEYNLTDYGQIKQHIYSQSSLAFYYSITCSEFPEYLVKQNATKDAVKKAIDSLINDYHAEVEVFEPINRNGFEGTYLTAKLSKEKLGLNNNNQLHAMAFLRGNCLYRVTAVGLGNLEEVETFFSSFKLMPL